MNQTRAVALDVLCAADAGKQFVDEVLAARRGELETRDRRLLQEIVFGTVRHRNTLDHILRAYVRAGVATQRPPIREALRLGAYQLVYLLRVPHHAAVDQTVEALKTAPGVTRREIGFLNAVLHHLAGDIAQKSTDAPREADDPAVLPIRDGWCIFRRPVLPSATEPLETRLALAYSMPEWLVRRWLARLGEEETRALLRAMLDVPLVTARVTRWAPPRDELLASLADDGLKIENGPRPDSIAIRGGDLTRARALALGWIQVQDVTAMEIGDLLTPPHGARVLDLCAAPGSKALQLIERIGETGHLVAADRSDEKLVLVRRTLERVASNFSTTRIPDDPDGVDLGDTFTHVLVDAPCSNTGVLARRPDARWRLRARDLESLASLQSKLLEAGWRHLAPGGKLLYATCSIEPEENEERIAEFIAAHPDATELTVKHFLPHRAPGDGGYASLLLKAR